jgi:3-isopropylmalate/(R)-2-methylmalate dehydratase small subunit
MEPVRVVEGTAIPLNRSDCDTDQIIPSDWLKRVERTGFGRGLFSEWRDDPGFVLNKPEYQGASILVAGPNFGTGSSREHAVWALQDYGFNAVVSSRFADIFRTNCTKVGLLPVQVEPDVATKLLDALVENPSLHVSIDVEARRVRAPEIDVDAPFELDDFTQWRLLEGLDDIGLSMRHDAEIAAHESHRQAWLPSTA